MWPRVRPSEIPSLGPAATTSGAASVLEDEAAVAVLEPAQAGEERESQQIFAQRFVRKDHGLHVSCYFGHVGHGCLHTRLDWDLSTRDGIRRYLRAHAYGVSYDRRSG